MLISPNTLQSSIKQIAPMLHDIARLKNSGIKLFKIPVIKLTIAATGMQQRIDFKSGFIMFSLQFVAFEIILIFKKLASVMHTPMPTIIARTPINFGKNQIEHSMNTEPTT